MYLVLSEILRSSLQLDPLLDTGPILFNLSLMHHNFFDAIKILIVWWIKIEFRVKLSLQAI